MSKAKFGGVILGWFIQYVRKVFCESEVTCVNHGMGNAVFAGIRRTHYMDRPLVG